jgi:hypothetical protein
MVVCSLITYTINHSRYNIISRTPEHKKETKDSQRSSCRQFCLAPSVTFLFLSPSCWRRTKNAYFSLGWVLYSTKWVKSTRAQHKHNHTTHYNQHELQPPYPPAALPSLSPWVEQWHHQIMASPLPDTIRRRRAVGLALAVVGLLAWGGEMRGIEK